MNDGVERYLGVVKYHAKSNDFVVRWVSNFELVGMSCSKYLYISNDILSI